jgi:hypothetical protein
MANMMKKRVAKSATSGMGMVKKSKRIQKSTIKPTGTAYPTNGAASKTSASNKTAGVNTYAKKPGMAMSRVRKKKVD